MTSVEDVGAALRGRRLSRVRRILYEVDGDVRSDRGPLELTFGGDESFVLQPASDGEALVMRKGAWADPFEPPLSGENEEFIRTHGKWTAVDVSAVAPYDALVGAVAELVRPVISPAGVTVGMEAIFEQAVLRVDVEGDELVVDAVRMGP